MTKKQQKITCPSCKKGQLYYRKKTNDFRCSRCKIIVG